MYDEDASFKSDPISKEPASTHMHCFENCQNRVVFFMLALCFAFTLSKEDGLARTPPRGWRSWNTFGSNVTQAKMEAIMDAMVRRDRSVDGVPTSLCDLGYCDGIPRLCAYILYILRRLYPYPRPPHSHSLTRHAFTTIATLALSGFGRQLASVLQSING